MQLVTTIVCNCISTVDANILLWKILLYLIFEADDPCHIHSYRQVNYLVARAKATPN